MKHGWKMAVCLAGAMAFNASLRAGDIAPADNPYSLIVARNIFNLLPPPPPPDPNPPPAEPAVKITPTGIMSVMGQSQVLFKASGGGKPGDQSYMLSEGQAEDEIEVVKIDQKNSSITFKNHGVTQEIPLSSAPSIPSAAAGQPSAVTFAPTPAFPAPAPFGGASGGNAPANTPANPWAKNANTAANNLIGGQGGVSNSKSGVNLQFGQTTQTQTAATQTQQTTLDPDVQQVLIVANHLKAIQDGDDVAKIFPATDLDDEAGVPSNVTPNPAETNSTAPP